MTRERRRRYYQLLHAHDSPEEREAYRRRAAAANAVLDFLWGPRSLRAYEPLARLGRRSGMTQAAAEQQVNHFEMGPSWTWCGLCGHLLEGDPERCPGCGADQRPQGTLTVTSVDRGSGTVTLE